MPDLERRILLKAIACGLAVKEAAVKDFLESITAELRYAYQNKE